MANVIEKIQKVTSKGQITLPISWRRKIKTGQVLVRTKKDKIEIFEVHLQKSGTKSEYTVFDALRDNRGRGLKVKDLIKILKKIDT